MSESVDLGYITLCVNASDVNETAGFYERVGFRPTGVDAPGVRRTVAQGRTILTFMNFLSRPLINFRGGSIHAQVTGLAERGFEIIGHNTPDPELELMLDENGEPFPDNECGCFTVIDPDGNHVFFNTHPHERAPYEAASWLSDPGMFAEVTVPFGQLVLCLDVKDLAASVGFYQGLGFGVIDQSSHTATVLSKPPHVDENPNGFPLRLRQAATTDMRISFDCDDAEGVAASLRSLEIEVIETPDGKAFIDPDDRRVVLSQSPK